MTSMKMVCFICPPAVTFFFGLLNSLIFSLHSFTMVDGVMILPVLVMIAFPSPSMEGKWLTVG